MAIWHRFMNDVAGQYRTGCDWYVQRMIDNP